MSPQFHVPQTKAEAETRLLTEALALDLKPDLDDDARGFVAGAITLLSADLGLVAGSEDLGPYVALASSLGPAGSAHRPDRNRRQGGPVHP